MIKTLTLAAASAFATSAAWAHSGHGPTIVDGHSHVAEAAGTIAIVCVVAGIAWLTRRYWLSR